MRYLLIATALAASGVAAQELPKMKAGYWETTTTTTSASGAKGAPAQSSKTTMCVNDAVQKDIMSFSQNMGAACSKHSVRRDGNKFIGEAECAFGASMMKSHSVTTFTSDTSYRTESRSTMTPPMAGMSESHTVQEAKYMGACPAGMKPGDMTMAGRTVNISDMMKMMQKGKK